MTEWNPTGFLEVCVMQSERFLLPRVALSFNLMTLLSKARPGIGCSLKLKSWITRCLLGNVFLQILLKTVKSRGDRRSSCFETL